MQPSPGNYFRKREIIPSLWANNVKLFLVILCLVSPLCAQSTVTLELQPSSVEVAPWYRQIELRVVLENTGTDTMLCPRLAAFTNDSLNPQIQATKTKRLGPHQSMSWVVRVTNLDAGRIPGTVVFDATYRLAGVTGRQHVYANLPIKMQAAGPDKPVEIALPGSFDSISEHRPGSGYLQITNNLDVPVRITSVSVVTPSIAGLQAAAPTAPFDIPPHSSTQQPVVLSVTGRLTPGKYAALLDVQTGWNQDGHAESRHFIVEKDVSAGVFFESDLLKVLGVPSFLLLPGCLVIFTLQLLTAFGWFGVNKDSRIPSLPITSPGFWIIAVSYSGIFAWLYSLFTHNDYLSRYGVTDLRNVWLWSIVIGGVGFCVFGKITQKQRSARFPDPLDTPLQILKKMQTNDIKILTGKVSFPMNGVNLSAFVIEKIEDDQARVWVSPGIEAHWEVAAANAHDHFTNLIQQRAPMTQIVEALEQGLNHNPRQVTLSWQTANSVPNPFHLKVDNITAWQDPDTLVTVT